MWLDKTNSLSVSFVKSEVRDLPQAVALVGNDSLFAIRVDVVWWCIAISELPLPVNPGGTVWSLSADTGEKPKWPVNDMKIDPFKWCLGTIDGMVPSRSLWRSRTRNLSSPLGLFNFLFCSRLSLFFFSLFRVDVAAKQHRKPEHVGARLMVVKSVLSVLCLPDKTNKLVLVYFPD